MTAFAEALERGELTLSSGASALQASLSLPHSRLRPYREALSSTSDFGLLCVALRVSVETLKRQESIKPHVELAWTYPGTGRPGLRTTGGVAREIIDSSNETLLIVGYSLTVDPTLSGLAAQTIDSIARAAERGVVVTAVLHRKANRLALLQAWRSGVQAPSIFTWPMSDDDKASVHAKVLVADRKNALVTSANLTYHGFERNIEMGVHVTGRVAGELHDRIHDLIGNGELVTWRE